MAVIGAGALLALRGYLWVQDGEILKASLLAAGSALGLAVAGWGWWRWKQARRRVYDPVLIREKVSRVAFEAELQIVAVLPADTGPQRARELLEPVAAAYRHYDHPAGARFRAGRRQAPADHGQPASRRSRPVRQTQRAGRAGGRLPVAPAWRRGRDAPGGALRLQSPAPVRQGRAGRRPGGRHHRRGQAGDPLPRGPAAPPPPLRGPHPHGQVHPDAPHRRPQAQGKGRGPRRRRHRGRRSPRRPGGRNPGAGARVPD